MLQSIEWKTDRVRIIDQTKLPFETTYVDLLSVEDVFDAIRQMKIRGAPAIGISAAYGLYLAFKDWDNASADDFFAELKNRIDYLNSARPTAVNLNWALQKIESELENVRDFDLDAVKEKLLNIALEIHEDDRLRCERMAEHGQEVISDRARILTHCNTGALATGGIGTAFGVIYKAYYSGKRIEVYATESRPVLQGARLTVYELANANIPATLICDSAAASLMKQHKVDLVIVGSDRIAANGSTANKIGTYSLALLANHHNIPFYVAAPLSTFDLSLTEGDEIPIEYRDPDEVRNVFNKYPITLPGINCWNPAFDVTPPDLISGIITEEGILRPPYDSQIKILIHRTTIKAEESLE